MLTVSPRHRFIFIHIPKTAGSAITEVVEPLARERRRTFWRRLSRKLPMRESPERAYFRSHDSAAKVRAKLGEEVWNSFATFAVVREPVDHAVSHFEFMKQFPSPRVAAKVAAMTFADYLVDRQRSPRPGRRIFSRMPDQAHYVTDVEGRIIVDRIIRLENLDAEVSDLLEGLGLGRLQLDRVNQTKARSPRRSVASYYDDPATVEMVRDIYARDFTLFGYSSTPPWRAPIG